MSKKEYPYQNRSLEDMEGEEWDDIPGLDGYFRVSNYGRIKRLRRESPNSKGIVKVYCEKIIAPRVSRTPNTYVSDVTYQLGTHCTVEKKVYDFQIRRLVYYCFVKPFNLEDSSILIVSKKGDGLDIRPENLLAVNYKQFNDRIVQQERVIQEFRVPDIHRIGMLASLEQTCKEISQYNAEGKRINAYKSTMEASRQTGISDSHIRNAARGIERTAGGYFWAYGNAESFDAEGFLEERHRGFKEKRGTKVTQYDLAGNRIAQYLSLADAANTIGATTYSNISCVLRGLSSSAYGFYWKRGWGKAKISKEELTGLRARSEYKKPLKPVNQYSKDGQFIASYPGIKIAAKAVGVKSSSLSGALTGQSKTAGGYKWEYK